MKRTEKEHNAPPDVPNRGVNDEPPPDGNYDPDFDYERLALENSDEPFTDPKEFRRWTHREYLQALDEQPYHFPQFEYIVDKILPAHEVHLVGGPSGAGKTTWLLKTIETWQKQGKLFGYNSYPVPFMYLSFDRSENGLLRVFERMKLDPRKYNLLVPEGKQARQSLVSLLKDLKASNPEIEVFFIEGFATRVPGNVNDQKIVADWLRELQTLCKEIDITIFGVMHTAKTKQSESYANPRQRITGSVAFAGYTETIVIIEPKEADNPDNPRRVVSLLPRNAPERQIEMEFQDGVLVEVEPEKAPYSKFLEYAKSAGKFTVQQAHEKTGIAESTLYRFKDKAKKDGLLRGIDHGVYEFQKSN